MPWERYHDSLSSEVRDRWINSDGSIANGEVLVEKLKPGQVYKLPPPEPSAYEIYAEREAKHRAETAASIAEIHDHLLSSDSFMDPASKRELAQTIALQHGRNA